MKDTNKPTWKLIFEEWLGGLTLDEKLRTLETGKISACIKCDYIFFDRETQEERQLSVECSPSGSMHECISFENYIILRRGFRNILDAAHYSDGANPKQAVIDYFITKYGGVI